MEKKLKIALYILIIVLISIVAFVGVYSKKAVSYENDLPDYLLTSDVKGKRITSFEIDSSTEEKIYDKDGNEVASIPTDANEEDYKKEQVKVNPDEILNKENYKKVESILNGRLKELGPSEYRVKLNEETGNFVIELPEGLDTNQIIQYLTLKGDFSITDSEDGTLLIGKSDVEKASVMYNVNESGNVVVYLSIKFNKEGTKKLAEVSKNYMKIEDSSSENTNSEENDNAEENSENEEEKQKQITMTLEGSEFLTTQFDNVISDGTLSLSVGQGSDLASVYDYMQQTKVYAMLLNNDEMPIEYNVKTSEYIENTAVKDNLYVAIGVLIGICVIIAIYMIVKFRLNGVFADMTFVLTTALLLLMIRYTNTVVSIGSVIAMLALIAIETYFIFKILNSIKNDSSYENVSTVTYNVYLKNIDVIIVLLIIAVVFTFMSKVAVYSIGMTLFYGIISILASNLAFMRMMLLARYRKEG